jgi:hypothetical protein
MTPDAIPSAVRSGSVSGLGVVECPRSCREVSTLLETRVPIIEVAGPRKTPCFVWQGCIDAQGYPDRGRRKHDRAHRQLWDLVRGDRPPGFTIHHLCEEKRCLNIEHMALISRAEHVRVHRKGKRKVAGRFQDTL